MKEFLDSILPFLVSETKEVMCDLHLTVRVVKQEFQPRLPGFVGLVIADGQRILFIADSTPEEFREYVMWHEVMCVLYRDRKGCLETLKEELERVPPDIKPAYVAFRLASFEALVQYYAQKPPEFYGEITASYEYLLSLADAA